MLGLLRDLRDRLHRGGAGADDADTFRSEVDTVMRPLAGVIALALERAKSLERRQVGGRERADGGDHVARFGGVALVGINRPKLRGLVEDDLDDALAELDVGLEIEAFGAMFEIAQNLVLLRIALGPVPFLQQVLVEGVAVNVAVGIAARAGIAIPVPGAADAIAGLEYGGTHIKLVA
jgi:hypothetical protein